jgi:hypothetical protein
MKGYTHFLVLLLCAAPRVSPAEELPIVFARSGQQATLPAGDAGKAGGSVVLSAFGQRWGQPAAVKNGRAEFVTPKVRVPVVFGLISVPDAKVIPGELVVYPDRPIPWDKDTQLVAAGIPDWFHTWSRAVGLPVQEFKTLEPLGADNGRLLEKPALLILGRRAAGAGPAVICRFAVEHKINVLVLEADWFGKEGPANREIVVLPKHMTGALADWHGESWPLPPAFRRHSLPWFAVANRQAWIAGAEYPLIEEIRSPQRGAELLRVVLSYLPWQGQLGRCEMADELFLRLLTETAKGVKNRRPLDDRFQLLYPPAEVIAAAERPVLAAALRWAVPLRPADGTTPEMAVRHNPPVAYVLDVRGKIPPSPDVLDQPDGVRLVEGFVSPTKPLLILGDNPILDSWKWLKLDRPQQRSARPGILWWPDNSLPPSLESQLRLMQLFTQWNIFLGYDPQGGSL